MLFNISNNVFTKKMEFLKVQRTLNQLDIMIKFFTKAKFMCLQNKKLQIKNNLI